MNQNQKVLIATLNWFFNMLLWGTILFGIIIRFVVLFQNRSIFIDEANLARNIGLKSFTAFFDPLDFQQYAPPLFSSIEKIFANIYGFDEIGLRIFPLICGIGTILVFYRLAQKFIPYTTFQWYPVAVLCLSAIFIRYSTEIKQYSTDAFLATLLLYWTVQKHELSNWKDIVFWTLLGSVLIWLSMPIVFVLASIGIYFLWQMVEKKDYALLPYLCTMGICWLLSFMVYYQLILKVDMGGKDLLDYHNEFFFPIFPTSMEELTSAGKLLRKMIGASIGTTTLAILWGSFTIFWGSWYLSSVNKKHLVLLWTPILLTFIASGLEFYSLIPRLSLFFFPILLLLSGIGAWQMFEPLNKPLRFVVILVMSVIIINQKGYEYLNEPLELEDLKHVLTELKQHSKSDEILYVHHAAVPAFVFYNQLSEDKLFYAFSHNEIQFTKWDSPLPQAKTVSKKKVWIVLSHIDLEQDAAAILAQMEINGTLQKQIKSKMAAAYLFELF